MRPGAFNGRVLLGQIGLGQSDCQLTDAGNHSHTLRYGDGGTRVKNIEQMRALQAQFVSGKQRKAFDLRGRGVLVTEERMKAVDQSLAFASYSSRCFQAFSTSAVSKL